MGQTRRVFRRTGSVPMDRQSARRGVMRAVAGCLAAAVLAGLLSPAAFAADQLECVQLLRAGKYAECVQGAAEGIAQSEFNENLRLLKLRAEMELGRYTDADFVRAMRDGVRPDGTALQVPMSTVTAYTRNMTDVEMQALWAYLHMLPPVAPRGN